jgi:polyphosphate kinase 2 (PPK2 family)
MRYSYYVDDPWKEILKRTSDLLIHPGEHLNLSDFDPDNTLCKSQGEINGELPKLRSIMAEMQYKLYIENEKSLLIVLQGMDT